MARWLVAALALMATPALAQTTTTCQTNPYSHQTTCYTPPAAPGYVTSAPMNSGGSGTLALILAARQAAQRKAAANVQAATEQALQRRVGELVIAGDCNGAVKAAVDAGRMDLAAQARGACVAPPPSPAP